MKRDDKTVRVPVLKPVPRHPIMPTKREESEKERTRRKPKHPPRDHE